MNELFNDIFSRVVEISIASSFLILAVILFRIIISKKASRGVVCLLWALVGIRLLVPFSIESEFSLIPEFSVKYSDYSSDIENNLMKENNSKEISEDKSKENYEFISEVNESQSDFDYINSEYIEEVSYNDFESILDISKESYRDNSGNYSEDGFEDITEEYSETKPESNEEYSETELESNEEYSEAKTESKEISGSIILRPDDMSTDGADVEKSSVSFENTNNNEEQSNKSERKNIEFTEKTIRIFGAIWFVGMTLLGLYGAFQYIKLKNRVSAFSLDDEGIRKCENIESPFVLGVIKPKIYVPYGLSEKTERYIISHEKAHIKRLDYISKILGFVALCVYWFNPLVWVGFVLFCRDIEYACDEKVVSKLDSERKKEYALALLECSTKGYFISACPVSFGEIGVKARVKNTLSYKKPLLLIVVLSVILCAVLSVLFMTDPKAAEGDLEIVSEETSKDESEFISEESRGEVSFKNESAEDVSNDTVSFLGICGEKLTYEIKDSLLVIQGTGEMFDYNSYDSPWWNKEKIEHVTVEEGVTSIGEKAFFGMKIKSVSLPETLKTIKSQAFQSCSIEKIIIPDSVDYVGGKVFEGCSSLESVDFGSSLKKTVGGTFRNCTSLKEVKLNNIEVISNEDFSGCTALEKIELENVTTVNNKAFFGCTSLLEINFSDSISYVGENVLNNTALYDDVSRWENGSFYVDNVLVSVDVNALGETYEVKSGTKAIAGAVFKGSKTLEKVVLPDSLVSIGSSAFSNCEYLKDIILPDSLASIGQSAFSYCYYLQNIKMPKTVKYLGQYAFIGCFRLEEVEIGSVTECGYAVFLGCDRLNTVTFANGASVVGGYMFDGCKKLKTVSLCDSIEVIGDGAFLDCSALEEITFPKNLKSVGCEVFRNCEKLNSVSLGESLESIGVYSFFKCSSLEKISLGKNVKEFGKYAFVDTKFYNDKSNFKKGFISIGKYLIAPEFDSDGKGGIIGDDNSKESESISEKETKNIRLYVCNENATALHIVESTTNGNIDNIITQLISRKCIPEGTKAYSFELEGKTAKIDLSADFGKVLERDFEEENIVMGSLFNTIIKFYRVENVVFTVESEIFEKDSVRYDFPIEFMGENITADIAGSGNELDVNWNIKGDTLLISGEGKMNDYKKGKAPWSEFAKNINKIEIEDGVTYIGKYAFYGTNAEKVSISSTVLEIGEGAFMKCSSLIGVLIPNSVTVVGEQAFAECGKLDYAVLSLKMKVIKKKTFYNCYSLNSVLIMRNVRTIEEYAFDSNSSLDIYFYDGKSSWDSMKKAKNWISGSYKVITGPETQTNSFAEPSVFSSGIQSTSPFGNSTTMGYPNTGLNLPSGNNYLPKKASFPSSSANKSSAPSIRIWP